jgi:hypothetical protein
MGEALIPIAEIAQFIIDLQRDVRSLKKTLRLKDKEFELESAEESQDVGGQMPATAADYKTPVTCVTSIVNETCIMVRRQIPNAGGEGWADDPALVTDLEVTLPTGVSPPEVGRIVQPVYTGLYQINTLSTTVSLPRYGLFGAGGGALKQYIVMEEFDEHLRCRTLIGSAPTTPGILGTEDVFVAKPWRLRRTPWDGTTVRSITYTYSPLSAGGNGHRLAEYTSFEQEIQRIVPTYVASFDIIYAGVVDGGTDISIVTTVTSVGTVVQRLTILDFNTDSRMFMRIAPPS